MSNPLADNALAIILNAFYMLLYEYPMGMESSKIVQLIS